MPVTADGKRTVNRKTLIMLLPALVAVVGQRRVGEWLWVSGLSFVVVPWAVDKGGSAPRMHIGLPPLAVAMWGKPDVFVVSGICLPALQYAVDGFGYQFHALVVGVGEDELSLDGVGFAVYVIQGVALLGGCIPPCRGSISSRWARISSRTCVRCARWPAPSARVASTRRSVQSFR